MPQPDISTVHIDKPLTNFSIASMNAAESFIAEKVFPSVPVKFESDKYFIFTKSHLFRSEVQVRGPSSPVKHRGYVVSSTNYQANEYATGILVPDRVASNSDAPLQPYENGTTIITHDMMMFKENNFGAEHMVTGTWTNNVTLSGADQWSDYANSNPLTDIDTATFTINGLTGIPTSQMKIAMGSAVWNKLKRHPSVINSIGGGYTGLLKVTRAMVADLFDVKALDVSEAVWNTNVEGNATQTLTRIIGKNCLVYYCPDSPGLMVPSAGYFMTVKQSEITRYDVRRRRSQAVEITSTFDFKVTDADAGYLIINAVA